MLMFGISWATPAAGKSAVTRTLHAAGACCLLLLVAVQATPNRSHSMHAGGPSIGSVSACDHAGYPSDIPKVDVLLSDTRFVAQGWRWSPGSTAWVAVLVRLDSLKTVALARIGGLYGP